VARVGGGEEVVVEWVVWPVKPWEEERPNVQGSLGENAFGSKNQVVAILVTCTATTSTDWRRDAAITRRRDAYATGDRSSPAHDQEPARAQRGEGDAKKGDRTLEGQGNAPRLVAVTNLRP
jgi:hypothetical protein